MSARTILNPPYNLTGGFNTNVLVERLNIGNNSAPNGNASIAQSSTAPYTLSIFNTTYPIALSSPTQIFSLVDSTGSSGLNGQVITANGSGGWVWATPA